MYVAQLLPDLEEARVLREALDDYTKKDGITEDQRDAAWSLLAELTKKLRGQR